MVQKTEAPALHKPTAFSGTRPFLLAIVAVGFLLHAYTIAFKAQGGWSLFGVGLFVYSLTPYTVAAALAVFRPTARSAAGFAAGALLGDLFMQKWGQVFHYHIQLTQLYGLYFPLQI